MDQDSYVIQGRIRDVGLAMVDPMIHLVVLRCRDLDRSHRFYEALSLRLEVERHEDGPIHYSCENRGVVLELYRSGVDSAGVRIGLGVPSLENAEDGLRALGVAVIRSGAASLFVRDPDGHGVVLQQAFHRTEP